MQSKRRSIIESVSNTIIGLLTSFCIQLIIYPVLNIDVKLSQNVIITFVFFIASIVRSYLVRRFFNSLK